MAFVKTPLYLTAKHRSFLKEEADRKGVSLADLLQKIVNDYIDHVRPKEDFLKIVALGRSSRNNISEDHDRHIANTLRAKHVR